MPEFEEGTRQWAEARMAKLASVEFDTSRDHDPVYVAKIAKMAQEYQDLADSLDSLPEGTPTYSREELEAAGQGWLL